MPAVCLQSSSGNDFKAYIFNVLCARTPLNPAENGGYLRTGNNIREYSTDGVQRLRRDELHTALVVLSDLFCQIPPAPGSTSEWSAAAAIAGHVVGAIYVMEGGDSGRGEMDFAWALYLVIKSHKHVTHYFHMQQALLEVTGQVEAVQYHTFVPRYYYTFTWRQK